MPDTGKAVTLAHSSQTFDLGKLNTAMDVVIEKETEAAGRYALVHAHGWPAGEAVEYARAAMFCIDNGIDPNQI